MSFLTLASLVMIVSTHLCPSHSVIVAQNTQILQVHIVHSLANLHYSAITFPERNLFFFFLTLSFIVTSFREQDEAYINSLRWSALVGLEPAYTRM